MGQRSGFKNIQIQCKQDFYDLFEDTFQQSGANSKAEFAKTLIENYLNPEEFNTPELRKAIESATKANENIDLLTKEINKLESRLALYETEELKEVLSNHKGEKSVFKNSKGQSTTIEINDLPDVFSAIFNSVKIK